MKILVTGSAGFIGSNLTRRLLDRGDQVIGIDNLNDYYDVGLKKARLARIENNSNYTHLEIDIADRVEAESAFAMHKPQRVVNLAAQAGVRYAAENPHVYVDSNVTGFLHILEGCRNYDVEHLVFASTSSVYGANTEMPFQEKHHTEHPLTLYAATKKANEMMAHNYAHLFGVACTGLRFFTVYGPWGRPDMALFLFTKAILEGKPIQVFNNGKHKRSFTYVDDIVEGVIRVLDKPASKNEHWDGLNPDPSNSGAGPFQIFNIGNEETVELLRYIELLEDNLGKKAIKQMRPLQPGDVPDTEASVDALAKHVGYKPMVSVEEGVANFVHWYRKFYSV